MLNTVPITANIGINFPASGKNICGEAYLNQILVLKADLAESVSVADMKVILPEKFNVRH
jgi:hypothetical protein